MADEENRVVIQITLDEKQAKQAFQEFEKTAKSSGKDAGKDLSQSIVGEIDDVFSSRTGRLGSAISKLGGTIAIGITATIGASIAALAGTFERALRGEELNQINKQFELLAANAGVASQALRDGFQSAAEGTVQLSDVLQSSSKFLSEFGGNASRLPEVLDVARRATQLFGGEVIQNFEQITQALATNQSRALKQFGIIVDTDKAYRDFAKSIGVTADQLSDAGKRQAFLDAALSKAQQTFKDVDTNLDPLSENLSRLRTAFNDITDAGARLVNSRLGTFFSDLVKSTTNLLREFAPGSIEEQAERLREKIAGLQEQVSKGLFPEQSGRIIIGRLQDQLGQIEQAIEKSIQRTIKTQQSGKDELDKQSLIDPVKLQADSLKAQEILLQANQQILALRTQLSAGLVEREFGQAEQIANIREQARLRAATLDADEKIKSILNEQQFQQLKANIIEQGELQAQAIREKSLLQYRQTVSNIIGQAIPQLFSQSIQGIVGAFIRGQNAFQAFSSAILSIIGDLLINIGVAMIAVGQAVEALKVSLTTLFGGSSIAAGLALIALGAALKAISPSAVAPSGGGAGGGGFVGGGEQTTPAESVKEEDRRQLIVNVDGSIFDTKETGLRIAEILQDSFRAEGAIVTA